MDSHRSVTYTAPLPPHIKRYVVAVGSRKRSAFVTERDAGRAEKFRSYWDGGSRDQYMAFDASGRVMSIPVSGAPVFTAEPAAWVPQVGDVLVIYGTFMGKPATPHIVFYK